MDGGYSPNPRSGFAVEGNEKLSSRLVGGRYRAPPFSFLLPLFLLSLNAIHPWLPSTCKIRSAYPLKPDTVEENSTASRRTAPF